MRDGVEREIQDRRRLVDVPISVRLKLSALWVSVMFLYVYVDILGFYEPGTIPDIVAGRVWEFDITQSWALGAMALMTIPALMVFLSLALPAPAARWTSIVVASLSILIAIGNAVGETWAFYWFGSVVEAVLLVLVVRYAWSWPRLVGSEEQAANAWTGVA